MAITGFNDSIYSSEVQEGILTLLAMGNEIVDNGLMYVIPGVHHKIAVPRLRRNGKMLQKRKKQPTSADSKGDLKYDEQYLEPHDMMAYTEFDPSSFEHIWRQFQPTGNLLFEQLPDDTKAKLLGEILKQVASELGDLYINGEYKDSGDDFLMNGILTQAAKVSEVIRVAAPTGDTTMLGKLKALRKGIPTTLRKNPNLKILMSVADFDTYDDELTARESKNADETTINKRQYKNIPIETLVNWPDDLLVATPCAPGTESNLFAAVNLQSDANVIQVDKVSNAGELFFVKILMKADTNIAFGEEFVAEDSREGGAFAPVEEV
jgi:hypothetical protein